MEKSCPSIYRDVHVLDFTVYVIQNYKSISPTCTKESWGPLQAKEKKSNCIPVFFFCKEEINHRVIATI